LVLLANTCQDISTFCQGPHRLRFHASSAGKPGRYITNDYKEQLTLEETSVVYPRSWLLILCIIGSRLHDSCSSISISSRGVSVTSARCRWPRCSPQHAKREESIPLRQSLCSPPRASRSSSFSSRHVPASQIITRPFSPPSRVIPLRSSFLATSHSCP
jgi:hypothetical protein